MSAFASSLYVGVVKHRRLRPKKHALRYRAYAMLVDLDELPALARALKLFSHNRFNIFSLHDRDYGDGAGEPLRKGVERYMRAADLEPDGGAIRLLTMPRILGYAFNPLSLYFCYGRDGALRAILYEVNNTFGQRHSYFLAVKPQDGAPIRQNCVKQLHVSPFMGMDMGYEFVIAPPGEKLSVTVVARDADGVIMTATQAQSLVALSDPALARVFFTHPLLTLKVILGIHFEALILWTKGLRLQGRPPSADRPVTLQPGGKLRPRPAREEAAK
jgi:DUF1365 family protein